MSQKIKNKIKMMEIVKFDLFMKLSTTLFVDDKCRSETFVLWFPTNYYWKRITEMVNILTVKDKNRRFDDWNSNFFSPNRYELKKII